MERDAKTKKLLKALSIGTPLSVALRYANIAEPLYKYWEEEHKAYSYVELKKAMKEAVVDANLDEPNPEILTRLQSSDKFRAECRKAYLLIEDCLNYQSQSIVRHLARISGESTEKAQIDASKWFLERALPTEFGNVEKEEEREIKPIEVSFVQPSEDSKRRIEEIEKDILGEAHNHA